MMTHVIHAGCILTPHERMEPGVIVVENGRITAVGVASAIALPFDANVIDASDTTVVPGMIDLHTHGGGGVATTDGTIESLDTLAAFYASHGTTGYLSTVSGSHERIEAGIDAALAVLRRNEPQRGAAILGIHIEGPFLSPNKPGAFHLDSIVPPNPELLAQYLDRAEGLVKLITLAPELPGADDVIRLAVARGVVCGAGHTEATWDEMMHAIDLGLSHAIHTFNAMTPLHHREPGVLGAALADDRLTAELIADGIHVHPGAMRLLVRAKGAARAVLITDSINAAGRPDGTYESEEHQITVANGAARLADGTLAGSMLTMERGLANLVNFGAATLAEAVEMGSTTPARVLDLLDRKGHIVPGADADLVALDAQQRVRWTMVGGRVVFDAAA